MWIATTDLWRDKRNRKEEFQVWNRQIPDPTRKLHRGIYEAADYMVQVRDADTGVLITRYAADYEDYVKHVLNDPEVTPEQAKVEYKNDRYILPNSHMVCEKIEKYNAPHHFDVVLTDSTDRLIGIKSVDFQEGPIKEVGVNGITNEDVLVMVAARLEGFQNSEFACPENAEALDHIYKALDLLNIRTKKRIARNVEGTSKI